MWFAKLFLSQNQKVYKTKCISKLKQTFDLLWQCFQQLINFHVSWTSQRKTRVSYSTSLQHKKAKAALFILCNLVRPIGKFVTVYKHVDVVKETAGLS